MRLSTPVRPPRSRALCFTALLALALGSACGGGEGPARPVDAAVAPPVPDPTPWVRALAARLPAALRAHVSALEPVGAQLRRTIAARRLDFYQSPAIERLYAGPEADFRFVTLDGLTPLGAALRAKLDKLKEDALDPADFHGDDLPKTLKRFQATLAEVAAVPMPPALTEPELQRLVEFARALPNGGDEKTLVERLLRPDGPLPAWAAAYPALETAQKASDEARARLEARLADAVLKFAAVMHPGNLTSEERAARRAVVPASPVAPATDGIPEGPAPAEHGGAGDDSGDSASAPISAPPGTDLPPILADRKSFLAERLAALVAEMKDAAAIDALWVAAQPTHPQYAPLKAALARYRAVGDEGFLEVKPRAAFGPGSRGEVVATLQKRLAQEGLFTLPATGTFDAATETAVRRFQRAHRLEESGRMDKRTWDEVEVPLGRRVRAIDRALDNVRASKIDEDPFFVLVNIPNFRLQAWRDGKVALDHKVVVGKPAGVVCDERTRRLTPQYATPRLSAEISRIVVAPYWLVTKDIKEKEYDPQRARDPEFYQRNGYEVIHSGTPREWVRQLPSPANSLGFVKLLFPNQFAVYIHDTPQKHFFEQSYRAASHGCVRLDDPQKLAQMVLESDGQWDPEQFSRLNADWQGMGRLLKPYDPDKYRRALAKGLQLQTEITLKTPVPVHLEYYTAQVADDGVVEFLQDLYGHDVYRWSPRNAKSCVPETQQAREGAGDLSDAIDRMERESIALGARIGGLPKHIAKLEGGDKDAKFLAARAKGLSTFVASQKTYAESIRRHHTVVKASLEKRKGEWTRELQAEAVKVKRLVDGFQKANDRTRKLCDEVERRGVR